MSVSIDKIEFKNYRQYGTGTIHFSTPGEYNLSVLIAKNGTGKTTLLNAITWCLYGKEPHLADESRALPIVNNDVLRKAQVDDLECIPASQRAMQRRSQRVGRGFY